MQHFSHKPYGFLCRLNHVLLRLRLAFGNSLRMSCLKQSRLTECVNALSYNIVMQHCISNYLWRTEMVNSFKYPSCFLQQGGHIWF